MVALAWFLICMLLFLFGSTVASFLNVLAYRLPRGENPFRGRSHCTACGETLKAVDLIPILSYVSLKGRCRYCGEKVSPRYMLVELAGGVLAILCYLRYGLPEFLFYFAVGGILGAIALADADTQEIPDTLNIALALLGILAIWVEPQYSILSRVIGVFVISILLLLLALTLNAFGGGDIKLMAAAGFLLGWQNTILAAFIGIVVGGVYAIVLVLRKKAGKGMQIAFGPHLCIGIYVALLFGKELIGWYLSFF